MLSFKQVSSKSVNPKKEQLQTVINTKQAKAQSKASCKWVRLKPVFVEQKLTGFAIQAVFVDSAQSQTRDALEEFARRP